MSRLADVGRIAETRPVGEGGMIGPIFGFVGFVRGHISARKRSGNRLDRLQYCEGYAISFLLSATLPGIAVGRFVGLR